MLDETRGFASQSHDRFAILGEPSPVADQTVRKIGTLDHWQEKSAGPNARAERVLERVHVKHATRIAGVKRDSQPTDAMSSLQGLLIQLGPVMFFRQARIPA